MVLFSTLVFAIFASEVFGFNLTEITDFSNSPDEATVTSVFNVGGSGSSFKTAALPTSTANNGFLQPLKQKVSVNLLYGNPGAAGIEARTRYTFNTFISFKCIRATRRISVDVNGEINFDQETKITVYDILDEDNVVEILIRSLQQKSQVLHIDVLKTLRPLRVYGVRIASNAKTQAFFIDQDDTFGLVVSNNFDAKTKRTSITVSKSRTPGATRRFVPCFNDRAVRIPYTWDVCVSHTETQLKPIPIVNAELATYKVGTNFNPKSPFVCYEYQPKVPMTSEALQLAIVPQTWYEDPSGVTRL